MPAIAIAESLTARGVSVSFAGSPERIEGRLVPQAGYELDALRTAGFPRRPGPRLARAILRSLGAPFVARRILGRRRPDVVVGAGGYTGGPMVLAAWTRRIPAVTTEADAHLGLANRLAVPFARRVFLSYPIAGRDGPRYAVVGRPIPARSRAVVSREDGRARFGLPADGPVVLVAGGSQGARALNEAAVAAFGEAGPAVLHLCGERDHDALAGRVSRPGYRLVAFTDEFGAALAAADVVVSRAGGAVWEIAAAGRPAILVPYPHATADHQTANARHFAAGGGAVLVPEPELDLGRQVGELLVDPERLARMGEAMRGLARPDAADVVAEELIRLAAARG
ncbi:MAG: UDP-N-acetylglucosamine--N-acetylmuramyl-(pentapeptide) pyrophosphoryl-undecaprenol N-acetylglucosamine transferase [Thermoleophilia bacterium]